MNLTLAGGKLMMRAFVRSAEYTPPANFYIALVTAATVPDKDTAKFSELTEIAAGFGYPSGGFQLSPNATDFDDVSSSSGGDSFRFDLKDVSFTEGGSPSGTIPASGDGASYWILTDDADGSPVDTGNRTVVAWWPVTGGPVTLTAGQTITLRDAFIRIGGNVAEVPTQREEGNADVTSGDGVKGSYTTLIASTSFKANEIVVTIETVPLAARDPFDVDIALDPSGTPEIIIPDIHGETVTAEPMVRRYRHVIPAGSEIGARIQGNGTAVAANVQVEIAGP